MEGGDGVGRHESEKEGRDFRKGTEGDQSLSVWSRSGKGLVHLGDRTEAKKREGVGVGVEETHERIGMAWHGIAWHGMGRQH